MLKLGEIFFKLRDYTPIPFVVVLVVFPSVTFHSLMIGTLMVIVGETIRIIGVSHIGGVSRTRTYSTGQKLITTGIFGHVRNPLYIGNFFLSLGLVVLANVNIFFTLSFAVIFFVQYIPIVNWEENNLLNVFGKSFEDYKTNVPRWIPSISNKMDAKTVVKPDYQKALRSERSTFIAIIILYIVVLGRSHWLDDIISTITRFF